MYSENHLFFSYGNRQSRRITGPECYIEVINPESQVRIKIDAILDTGSVITLIPKIIIARLGTLENGNPLTVRGENNSERRTQTYILNITMGTYDFLDMDIIPTPKQYALIGRDILNQHKFVLESNLSLNIATPTKQNWRINCRNCHES